MKDTVCTDFVFSDMGLTSDGEILLLADNVNSRIMSLSKEKTISTLLRTSRQPTGVCCLNNNIVVVFGDDCKVEVYNRNGKVVQTIDHKFSYPDSIAVNNVNQDICICELGSCFYQRKTDISRS